MSIENKDYAAERQKGWSWKKVVLSLLALLLLAVLGILAYALYDDHYVRRGHFFEGTQIAGIDVSNRTRPWAAKRVRQEVAEPLLSPLKVTYRQREWTLDTNEIAQVDIDGMVDEAYRAGWDQGVFQRVYRRWLGEPMKVDVKVRFEYDRGAMGKFVSKLAKEVNRKPVDARQYVEGHKIKISPSREGYALYRKDTFDRVSQALPSGKRQLSLNVAVLKPKVTKTAFKHALFLNLSENRLYLYTYDKITKSYRVATGAPGFRTPTGDWKIVNKRFRPTWVNPHEAWSAGMPDRILPGPGNPLGTRALDLNAPAIRIHGTYASGSIGSYASHGCIRMRIPESEDLFPRVDVGTPVYIRW